MATNATPDLVWALNTINGQVGQIARHVFEHPTFAGHHVEVAPFTESFDSASWTPSTAAEYLSANSARQIQITVDDDASSDAE